MFDITSFIREKIFRRPKLVVQAGEELSEKQTTKLGYFLLYCMFAAILMSAQWTLSIIREIPTQPNTVPNCVSNLLDVLKLNSSNYSFQEDAYKYKKQLLHFLIFDDWIISSFRPWIASEYSPGAF